MEIVILALAVALDTAFGDPPNAIHPVAWMGKFIALLEKLAPQGKRARFVYGIAMTLVTMLVFAMAYYLLLLYVSQLHFVAGVVLAALLLKSTFSLRGLRTAALKVKELLEQSKLPDARFELRALVSRNTDLPKPLLVSAAVESVAEGACDSLVAPLFYFLLFGIPGAVAYRAVNTLDAMIGYHGEYEHLGKFAARLDDVLNFIPARITALLIVAAAFVVKRRGKAAWRTARRDHRQTASPNAGWPMAAMAGALNVRLEKPEHYRLGDPNTALKPAVIEESLKLLTVSALGWILVCFLVGVGKIGFNL